LDRITLEEIFYETDPSTHLRVVCIMKKCV